MKDRQAKKEPRRIRPVRRKAKRSPAGASPGTLVADPAAIRSALSLTLVSPGETVTRRGVSIDDVAEARADWPLIWLDCVGLADVELIAGIGAAFGLHPLALEDTVNTSQRPKLDFYDDHAFFTVSVIEDLSTNRCEQVSIFFGEGFVVSFQESESDRFDAIRARLELPGRLRNRKSDYFAYALVDTVVDGYFQPVETAGETIDEIEEEMLANPGAEQVGRLHELRRQMAALKRSLWPLRDALAGLIRADAPYLGTDTRLYVNDTLDHVVRQIELVETYRETVTGLIELHLSLAQARTNQVISLLTLVSTIFIPLTFLAGIWGMNFDPAASPFNMPELGWRYGYPVALGAMAAIGLSLFGFFRWRKWL